MVGRGYFCMNLIILLDIKPSSLIKFCTSRLWIRSAGSSSKLYIQEHARTMFLRVGPVSVFHDIHPPTKSAILSVFIAEHHGFFTLPHAYCVPLQSK